MSINGVSAEKNWSLLAEQNLMAAKILKDHSIFPSSVSRAYYSAYAQITSKLHELKMTSFPANRHNPSHEQLVRCFKDIARRLGMNAPAHRSLVHSLRNLQRARIDADYRPQALIDNAFCRDRLRDASAIHRAFSGGRS